MCCLTYTAVSLPIKHYVEGLEITKNKSGVFFLWIKQKNVMKVVEMKSSLELDSELQSMLTHLL